MCANEKKKKWEEFIVFCKQTLNFECTFLSILTLNPKTILGKKAGNAFSSPREITNQAFQTAFQTAKNTPQALQQTSLSFP